MDLIWALIALLVVLWLLGWAGPAFNRDVPRAGRQVHLLAAIAVLLIVLALAGVI